MKNNRPVSTRQPSTAHKAQEENNGKVIARKVFDLGTGTVPPPTPGFPSKELEVCSTRPTLSVLQPFACSILLYLTCSVIGLGGSEFVLEQTQQVAIERLSAQQQVVDRTLVHHRVVQRAHSSRTCCTRSTVVEGKERG